MNETINPDFRIYATVLFSDHSLQYYATIIVNILATPISFLSFYLILRHSKHEKMSYKFYLFASHLSFYLAQLQMGLLGGLVTLNPFPGVYCQGLLSKYFDAFTLVVSFLYMIIVFSIKIIDVLVFFALFLRLFELHNASDSSSNCGPRRENV